MTLYSNALASVLINGEMSNFFSISRSARQGCPLTPFLFVIVNEALSYHLTNRENGIQGLKLSDNSTIVESFYVNDGTLYLTGDDSNLTHAAEVLD